MKKLLHTISILFAVIMFCSCGPNPVKSYHIAVTYLDGKKDTVIYYHAGDNLFFMENSCLVKYNGPNNNHSSIVCGISQFKVVSIRETPVIVKMNNIINN